MMTQNLLDDPVEILRLTQIEKLGLSRTEYHRKLCLFACGCCRQVWHLFTNNNERNLIETLERFVDGKATYEEIKIADRAAFKSYGDTYSHCWIADSPPPIPWIKHHLGNTVSSELQAELLRCIFPVTGIINQINNNQIFNQTTNQIAKTIYDNNYFDDIGILADTIEETGITNKTIINHLRKHKVHIRGCWVIDLILNSNNNEYISTNHLEPLCHE